MRPLKHLRAYAVAVTALSAAVATILLAAEPNAHSYMPKDGFVPNQSAAIAIAVAVWVPIYGEPAISRQRPYIDRLVDDAWIVEGSLPEGIAGGVARAEIAKKDARILRVTHGR
jgi:hypothetical protein